MPKMCNHCMCVEDSIFTNRFEKLETLLEKALHYLSQNCWFESMSLFLFSKYLVSFFRFHIQVISYGSCLSLCDVLHLV